MVIKRSGPEHIYMGLNSMLFSIGKQRSLPDFVQIKDKADGPILVPELYRRFYHQKLKLFLETHHQNQLKLLLDDNNRYKKQNQRGRFAKVILRTTIENFLEYSREYNQYEVQFSVSFQSIVLRWIYSTRKSGSQEESYCGQIL